VSHVGHKEIEEREKAKERDSGYRGVVYISASAGESLRSSAVGPSAGEKLDRHGEYIVDRKSGPGDMLPS
jgi:hypothetical protein